jgi:hypothetical protein
MVLKKTIAVYCDISMKSTKPTQRYKCELFYKKECDILLPLWLNLVQEQWKCIFTYIPTLTAHNLNILLSGNYSTVQFWIQEAVSFSGL